MGKYQLLTMEQLDALDYSCKTPNLNKEALNESTQWKLIVHLAEAIVHDSQTWQNFQMMICPSKQLRAMSDTSDRHILMYLRARQSVLLQV